MIQNTAWLLLAYQISDIFESIDSLTTQFTFLWILRQSRFKNYEKRVKNQDEEYRKGIQKIIENKTNELKEAIKEVDGIQGRLNEDPSFSISNKLKDNVEKAMQNTFDQAMIQKKQIANNLEYHIPKNKQDDLINDIMEKTKNGKSITNDVRVGIERDVRTTLATESSKRSVEIAQNGGSIFFCCNHLSDCADDHASLSPNGKSYQDELFITKNYKSTSVYKLHKDAIDKIIADKHPIILEDAMDGTIEYTYTLKSGATRRRGLFLCTRWNCRHNMMPIATNQVADIDKFRKSIGKQMWNGNYDKDKYKALQEIRQCERNIRSCKTDIEMLKNALNYASNQRPIRDKIKELNKQIKANKDRIEALSNKYNVEYKDKEKKRQQIETLSFDIGAFK